MIPEKWKMRPTPGHIDPLIRFASWLPKNSIMAEIGTYLGESSRVFLDSKNVSFLFCVDPYFNNWDDTDIASDKIDMQDIEKCFNEEMKSYSSFLKLKMTGLQFASILGNNSLDVVYIDANHSYDSVKKDIDAFLPKVKKGGWFCGHDYILPGVQKACLEIFKSKPWSTFDDTTWVYRL